MSSSYHSHQLRSAVQLLLAGALVAGTATAQEQSTQSTSAVEEVVVTGYRESLEQSLDMKRATSGAVDAIFAEDIADFPDTNLAESVQRVPGVAILWFRCDQSGELGGLGGPRASERTNERVRHGPHRYRVHDQ